MLVVSSSGLLSACFACGLAADDPTNAVSLQYGTSVLWQDLPVLAPREQDREQ